MSMTAGERAFRPPAPKDACFHFWHGAQALPSTARAPAARGGAGAARELVASGFGVGQDLAVDDQPDEIGQALRNAGLAGHAPANVPAHPPLDCCLDCCRHRKLVE